MKHVKWKVNKNVCVSSSSLKNVTKTDFYYKNILKIKIKSDNKTEWIPVSFPKLIQSSLLPIQIHGQIELNWIRNLTGFQGNNFVCVGGGGGGSEEGMLVVGVYVF